MIRKNGMELNEVLKELKKMSLDPEAVGGRERFDSTSRSVYGVFIPKLRKLAKAVGCNHQYALRLWQIAIRETRVLAGMIVDPSRVSETLMEEWVRDLDHWEVCDQTCQNVFEKTAIAYDKAAQWSNREEEYVKRAAFVMMARLAICDKQAIDERFSEFLSHIQREAGDERPMVKKAVNWALRQIGKRNPFLNEQAIKVALTIRENNPSKDARWIASDALRELQSATLQERLHNHGLAS